MYMLLHTYYIPAIYLRNIIRFEVRFEYILYAQQFHFDDFYAISGIQNSNVVDLTVIK